MRHRSFLRSLIFYSSRSTAITFCTRWPLDATAPKPTNSTTDTADIDPLFRYVTAVHGMWSQQLVALPKQSSRSESFFDWENYLVQGKVMYWVIAAGRRTPSFYFPCNYLTLTALRQSDAFFTSDVRINITFSADVVMIRTFSTKAFDGAFRTSLSRYLGIPEVGKSPLKLFMFSTAEANHSRF